MQIITKYEKINLSQWQSLVSESPTGTWFQTPEAYKFYALVPEEMMPFVVAVVNDGEGNTLRAVCVGYVTVEKNPIKQFLTRRAIIIGGPALAEDITEEELTALLNGVKFVGARRCSLNCNERRSYPLNWGNRPIYVETRNFNSYEHWRTIFERCGFEYEPHLNFHINTSSFAGEVGAYGNVVAGLMGKGRVRDIKTSFREGLEVVDCPTIDQVREYYLLLQHLYKTKIKTPLFSLSFFESLYRHPDSRFILTALHDQIVGGTVCVAWNDHCLYEWFVCGMDDAFKFVFPSSVATYAGIRYAGEHDMPRFDMMGAGKPGDGYGVRTFKERFGGELVEHGRFKYISKPMLYKIGELGVKVLKIIK